MVRNNCSGVEHMLGGSLSACHCLPFVFTTAESCDVGGIGGDVFRWMTTVGLSMYGSV